MSSRNSQLDLSIDSIRQTLISLSFSLFLVVCIAENEKPEFLGSRSSPSVNVVKRSRGVQRSTRGITELPTLHQGSFRSRAAAPRIFLPLYLSCGIVNSASFSVSASATLWSERACTPRFLVYFLSLIWRRAKDWWTFGTCTWLWSEKENDTTTWMTWMFMTRYFSFCEEIFSCFPSSNRDVLNVKYICLFGFLFGYEMSFWWQWYYTRSFHVILRVTRNVHEFYNRKCAPKYWNCQEILFFLFS